MPDIPPIEIPGYEVLSLLGKGGMGSVYRARQVSLNREVALKVIHIDFTSEKELVARFLREAQAAARLRHPNIVVVHEVAQSGNLYYLSMELVAGESGQAMLTRLGRLDELAALRIAAQVARALQHAHEHGILHRDVKPANILVTRNGVVKLCDFGLARPVEHGCTFTQRGVALGTPYYMAPEQGDREMDVRADIYSLGATLYHLVTGVPPFDGPGMMAILMKHIMDPLPSPRTHRPELSEATEAIILHAMEKRPEDRYPTPGEMAEALEREVARQPVPTSSPPRRQLVPRRVAAPSANMPDASRRARSSEQRMQSILARREINRRVAVMTGAIGIPLLAITVGVWLTESRRQAAAAAHDQAVATAARLVAEKQWKEAADHIDEKLAEYPDDPTLIARRRQTEEALAKLHAAVSKADRAFDAKDFAAAKAAYMDALLICPLDERSKSRYHEVEGILYRLDQAVAKGDKLIKDGDAEGALAAYSAALELCPASPRALTGVDEARNLLAPAPPPSSSTPQAPPPVPAAAVELYQKAVRRTEETRAAWQDALADLDHSIQLAPDYGPAWYERGRLHEKLGRDSDAIADYARAIRAGSFVAESRYATGRILYDEVGSIPRARAEFEAADRQTSDWKLATLASARLALADREFARAIDLAKQVVQRTQCYCDAYCVLGQAYACQPTPDLDKSLECLNQAISLDPTLWATWVMRSTVYNLRKDYELGLADANKAVDMSNAHPWALQKRGWNLIGLQRYEEAVRQYDAVEKQAVARSPYVLRDRGDFQEAWAGALKHAGRTSDARQHLQSAIMDWEKFAKVAPQLADREDVRIKLTAARTIIEGWR